MNAIAQITASNEICDLLVTLGITPRAFFWHLKEEDVWDVWEFAEPPAYEKNAKVPAWTKEELDIMLGGTVGHPSLPEQQYTKVRTKKEDDDNKTVFEYEYIFYDIKSMTSWRKSHKLINPGAQASATILTKAIREKWITPEEANDRYNQFFTPIV